VVDVQVLTVVLHETKEKQAGSVLLVGRNRGSVPGHGLVSLRLPHGARGGRLDHGSDDIEGFRALSTRADDIGGL